jgi:hypothetical protein
MKETVTVAIIERMMNGVAQGQINRILRAIHTCTLDVKAQRQ